MNARFALLAVSAFLLSAPCLVADQIPVRHVEGRIHGFLILRDLDGKVLASGTSVQNAKGNQVTSEVDFRFKDGSLYRETSVFSQRIRFQLLNYHLVQKGPAFKSSIDMSVNFSTGHVTVHYTDHDGAGTPLKSIWEASLASSRPSLAGSPPKHTCGWLVGQHPVL